MLFPRFSIPNRYRPMRVGGLPRPEADSLSIRWLGTAGYALRYRGRTLLVDPFVSRPRLWRLASTRLRPDAAAIARHVPEADFIACGHSHFDHLMDAPEIARRTGAHLLGSASTAAVGRASGLSEDRITEIPAEGAVHDCGPFRVRFIPSLHGRLYGDRIPAPGTIHANVRLPARVWNYRMGGAFGLLIEAGGRRIYHNGSADLVDAEIEGERADVLLVGLALRQNTRDYLPRLAGLLGPKLLVPTHYDAFFAPLEAEFRVLPNVDMTGFFGEAEAAAPKARILMPYPLEELRLTPDAPPLIGGRP